MWSGVLVIPSIVAYEPPKEVPASAEAIDGQESALDEAGNGGEEMQCQSQVDETTPMSQVESAN
jgi:hypothetical protein